MTVPVGGIIRATLYYTSANASTAQTVHYWDVVNAPQDEEDILTAIAVWVSDNWADEWASMASASSELTKIKVQEMNTDFTVKQNIGEEDIGQVGGAAGGADGAAMSAYIQMGTSLPKQIGRKYIPFPADAEADNGAFTAGTVADMAVLLAFALGYIDIATVASLRPGILSRTLNQFVPFNGTGSLTDIPAYQRRRKPNVGS